MTTPVGSTEVCEASALGAGAGATTGSGAGAGAAGAEIGAGVFAGRFDAWTTTAFRCVARRCCGGVWAFGLAAFFALRAGVFACFDDAVSETCGVALHPSA